MSSTMLAEYARLQYFRAITTLSDPDNNLDTWPYTRILLGICYLGSDL